MQTNEVRYNKLVYSGSFNPLHAQHVYNMLFCEDLFPNLGKCLFEISRFNCRKETISQEEAEQRSKAILSLDREVLITTSPTFAEKCKLFKRSIFIIGSDTYEYFFNVEKSWFSHKRLLKEFLKEGLDDNCFVVLPREKESEQWSKMIYDHNQLMSELHINPNVAGFVEYNLYRQDAISSTSIRGIQS